MLIIGHRGARGLAPENTLASLAKGVEHHAAIIEFDIRVSSDAIPLLHHDAAITDADGTTYVIEQHTFAELQAHKLDLTTLDAALEYLRGKALPYIEVKPQVNLQPIISVIQKYLQTGYAPDSLFVASKSQAILTAIHTALPQVATIVIEPWSGVRATLRARQIDTKYIAMNQLWLWKGFIGPMQRRGWQIFAYTLNDTTKAARWKRYGLSGVVTDYPDLFEK